MRSRKTLRILVVAGEQGSRDEIRAIVSAIPNVVCSMANSISRTDRREDTAEHDILLLDIRGSEPAFLAPLRELRARGDATPCVVICDPTGPEIVREVLRHGAQDVVFASEVTSGEALLGVLEAQRVRTALTARTMRRESSRCAQPAQDAAAVRGQSDAMRQVREVMSQVAGADSPVLICGESGAGKGLVAHTLHEMGRRCAAPFITVNCDALPLSLAESKLFGHERGAFTGAHLRARGLLEMAGAGTLLLDEVADLPLEVQPKLLQALEERRFRPVGAEYEVPFLARVLASTSGDLEARVRSGHFRLDLYYRLAVVVLRLPSLEARADDIPELVAALVEGRPRALRFTPEALAWLMARPWPGNVRELRNVVERLGLVAGSEPVDVRTLEQVAGGGPDRKDSVMERACNQAPRPATARPVWHGGAVTMSPTQPWALVVQEPNVLTRAEREILVLLGAADGEVVPRTRLARLALGRTDRGARAAIDLHVSNLRKKLGSHAWRVQTVRGEGVRLVNDAEPPFEAARSTP